MSLDSVLTSTVDLPLQSLIESMLPAGVLLTCAPPHAHPLHVLSSCAPRPTLTHLHPHHPPPHAADAVERVHTGLLGKPDSTAAKVTKHWDPHTHPDGRPLHADEALLTDVLTAAWPYIASMAQTAAWDMIPELLKTTAPRWLADLELKKCEGEGLGG